MLKAVFVSLLVLCLTAPAVSVTHVHYSAAPKPVKNNQ